MRKALMGIERGTSEQWFGAAGFKMLCVLCWDQAKKGLRRLLLKRVFPTTR